MTDNNLELAFYGDLIDGHDLASTQQNIAGLFKASESQVERMFSGNRVVIKNRLDAETAEKYVVAMRKRGALCKIEIMGQPGTEFRPQQATETAPAADTSNAQQPESPAQSEMSHNTAGDVTQSNASVADPGKGAVVQVEGERLLVAGDQVDQILGHSNLEVTELGTRMQDETKPVSEPDLPNLGGVDIMPLGSRMQDEDKGPELPTPDTSHLTLNPLPE